VTIIGDGELAPESADIDDSFDLALRVGSVYDVLRHPDTETPLAVAIYGDWGAGKTSAMRWLDGRLRDWNKRGRGKNRIKVHPAWFYPWKYHEKQDVWRGLVAEIILKCLELEGTTAKTVLSMAGDLGRFLGAAFVDMVSGLKIKTGIAEADLSKLKDLRDHAREFVRPEAAYLNEFEAALEKWIGKTLGKNERMVVFIDDLDRCMPEVALQVLEALKLYLNIPRLIFVLGVDRSVVEALVAKHYGELGLAEAKSRDYLAKMFQVEVALAPSQPQIESFLQQLLEQNPAWQALDATAKEVFGQVTHALGARSPREIKRLVNSSLMAGAGARLSALADQPGAEPPTPTQGMQVFFVRRVLEDYKRATLVGDSERGTPFFRAWFEAVAAGGPTTVRLPTKLTTILDKARSEERGGRGEFEREVFDRTFEECRSEVPEAFHALVSTERFRRLLDLLQDPQLGELMRLPYPAEGAVIGGALGDIGGAALVREAVAEVLGKDVADVTPKDWSKVTELDLSDSGIADLDPLRGLSNLETLDLTNTQVADLDPLRGLSNLERLDLTNTQVADLEPLRGFSSLIWLVLEGTKVVDLRPLRGLSTLEWLDLERTQVVDLEPLRGLAHLEFLWLSETQVEPESLQALQQALPELEINS
jgi:hypothetical protein